MRYRHFGHFSLPYAKRRKMNSTTMGTKGFVELFIPQQLYEPDNSKVRSLRRESQQQETILDEAVWGRGIPDELWCIILACLPLSSLCRLQTVCKSWNRMKKDSIFLRACSRMAAREPLLVLHCLESCSSGPDPSFERHFWIYEPALNVWKNAPILFFQRKGKLGRKVRARMDHPGLNIKSARGMIMLRIGSHFLLYNPLNASVRSIPRSRRLDPSSQIEVIVNHLDDYNILVLDKSSNVGDEAGHEVRDVDGEINHGIGIPEPIKSKIYDSRLDSWTRIRDFDPEYRLSIGSPSIFNKKLMLLTMSRTRDAWFNDLAIFSLSSNGWEEEKILMPRDDLRLGSPYLFSRQGKLMLVAALPTRETRKQVYPDWDKIVIWEIDTIHPPQGCDGHSVRVLELDHKELPDDLWNIPSNRFMFLSGGNCIYFGLPIKGCFGLINLSSQTWNLLPMWPASMSPRANPKNNSLKTFLFEPRFDVVL